MMSKHSWLSQRIRDHYGSKRGLLIASKVYWQNILTRKHHRYAKIPTHVERVVFVCKGNICRSALAEHAFRKISSIATTSFGLNTHNGKEGNPRISRYAKKIGVNMERHRTTAVDGFESKPGDLFVCMEPDHVRAIEELYRSKSIVLLGFFGKPKKLYIHDPYSSDDVYAFKCTNYIVETTYTLARELRKNPSEFT